MSTDLDRLTRDVARARAERGLDDYDGPPFEGWEHSYGGIDRLLDVLRAAAAELDVAGGFDHERGAVALRWLEHEVFPLVAELRDSTLRHDMIAQLESWVARLGGLNARQLAAGAQETVLEPGGTFTVDFQPQYHYRDSMLMFHVGRTHQIEDTAGLWLEQVNVGTRGALGAPMPLSAIVAPGSTSGGLTVNTSRVLAGEFVRCVLRDRRTGGGPPRYVSIALVGDREPGPI